MEQKNEDDYIHVLKALIEIPFPVGKNLLVDFLRGNPLNPSVQKNHLGKLRSFGSLDLSRDEILKMIENLIQNKMIEVLSSNFNKFIRVLEITLKGKQERFTPTLNAKKLKNKFNFCETQITENDKMIFKELDSFLKGNNDFQKKAIVSAVQNILCIAGAGSGKTSVLTKRIEFLVKIKGVDASKILAITFTRKARQEMQERLIRLGVSVKVETFNSFCEKILKTYSQKIYGKLVKIMSYTDKFMAMNFALDNAGIQIEDLVNNYFSFSQRQNKSVDELSRSVMNDCFFILDYFKSKSKELEDFSKNADAKHFNNARKIYEICKSLGDYMKIQGLYDYTDQVIDVIHFLKKNQNAIPIFEHVLVDEFQDVNAMQIELLDLLNSQNTFCVGDPRQSIFGWRGSDINYILDFESKYQNSEVISLIKNYRSNNHIVDFMNKSIKEMELPNLEHDFESEKDIKLYSFSSEEIEFGFVCEKILESSLPLGEIFVLARTNRQLKELSSVMNSKKIKHVVKTDEINRQVFANDDEVTLATIHAIKGLEAKMVFVIGCTESNFPCRASDHPVIEIVKIDEYDKEEEEKRLFYVSISRAKESLYLTYSGKKPTNFISPEMKEILDEIRI